MKHKTELMIIFIFVLMCLTVFFNPIKGKCETVVAYANTVSGGKVLLLADLCPWNPNARAMVIIGPTGAVVDVRSWVYTGSTWKTSELVIGFDGAMNGINYPRASFHVIPVKDRKDVPLFQ